MPQQNQTPPPDPTPAIEALLVSHHKHASTHTAQNAAVLDQAEKNNPVPVLQEILAILKQLQAALPQPAINSNAPPTPPGA